MDEETLRLVAQIRGELEGMARQAAAPTEQGAAARKAIQELAADLQVWAGRNIEPDPPQPAA